MKKSKIPLINKYVWCNKGNINIGKKNFTGSNYKRLPRTMVYIENNLKDSARSMYLTIDPLI